MVTGLLNYFSKADNNITTLPPHKQDKRDHLKTQQELTGYASLTAYN